MILINYYEILGLPINSSIEVIKKAYRKKARLYHPDLNHSPDAKDKFIAITEAYDFLLANQEKIKTDNKEYQQAMDDWRKYRQDRSRKRATAYARTSFITFKNSDFYKTTRIIKKLKNIEILLILIHSNLFLSKYFSFIFIIINTLIKV